MKHGKSFLWGTAATMAFSYLFEKMNAKGASDASAGAAGAADAASTPAYSATDLTTTNSDPANPTSSNSNPTYSTPYSNDQTSSPAYQTSNPTYSPTPNPTYSTSNPAYSTSNPNPNPSYPTPPQTQNGYQRRDVTGPFDQPLIAPWFANDVDDGLASLSGSSIASIVRSTLDDDRQGTYYKNDRNHSPAVTGRPLPRTF